MAPKKKSALEALGTKASEQDIKVVQGPDITPEDFETPKMNKMRSDPTGKVRKSVNVTKEMERALLLAKADHRMTYDQIVNEALELWFAKKGAKTASE